MAFVDYGGAMAAGRDQDRPGVTERASGPPTVSSWGPPTGPAAGWYRDPYGRPGQRYFDGRTWTEEFHGRFRERPCEATPVLDVRAAVGAVVVLAISLVGSRLLVEAALPDGWPIVAYVAVSIVVGYGPSVAWCRWATRRWGSGRPVDDLGLRPRWSDLGWGPVVWLSAVAAQVGVAAVIWALDIPFTSNTEGLDGSIDRTYVLTVSIAAVVAAPIVEEVVFRAVILRGLLSRWSAPVAVAGQGVVFGLVHIDPVRGAGNIGLVAVLAAVGVVLGAAAHLLGRLPPTMIAHAILNAVVLVVVLNR